jgi:hypothetical protein
VESLGPIGRDGEVIRWGKGRPTLSDESWIHFVCGRY